MLLPASCRSGREILLPRLPDLVDRGTLSEIGQAPAIVHPHGVRAEVELALAEEDLEETGSGRKSGRTAFVATFTLENGGDRPMEFAWGKTRLALSMGPRLTATSALAFDEEEDSWKEAPTRLRPGERALVLLRFPLSSGLDPARILRVCLHWGYRYGSKSLAVASRARLP